MINKKVTGIGCFAKPATLSRVFKKTVTTTNMGNQAGIFAVGNIIHPGFGRVRSGYYEFFAFVRKITIFLVILLHFRKLRIYSVNIFSVLLLIVPKTNFIIAIHAISEMKALSAKNPAVTLKFNIFSRIFIYSAKSCF
jgi:hypothetical protein